MFCFQEKIEKFYLQKKFHLFQRSDLTNKENNQDSTN